MKRTLLAAASAAVIAMAWNAPVMAQEFFKDKTLTVVVPSGSGGTFHI